MTASAVSTEPATRFCSSTPDSVIYENATNLQEPTTTTRYDFHSACELWLQKGYYHYADIKRSEIIDLRAELSKVDNSEDELDMSSDDES